MDATRIFDRFLPLAAIPSSRYHSAIPFYYSLVLVIVCGIIPRNIVQAALARWWRYTRSRRLVSQSESCNRNEREACLANWEKRSHFAFDRLRARSLRQLHQIFSMSSARFPSRESLRRTSLRGAADLWPRGIIKPALLFRHFIQTVIRDTRSRAISAYEYKSQRECRVITSER